MEVIAAFSGGKDSTAMVLEIRPKYLLTTPTGNELSDVAPHVERVANRIGADIINPPGPTLPELIYRLNAVPNPRMRFCTRLIKIRPAIDWLRRYPEFRMAVGLRADEEMRDGVYGLPDGRSIFPMRDAGHDLAWVRSTVRHHDVAVPIRTDCAVCPFQRLGEWWRLWENHPLEWARGEHWEAWTRHTFRSPSRDTWPAAMAGLRARFENGDKPRGADDEDAEGGRKCRVCTL